jgi:hypothetical protein
MGRVINLIIKNINLSFNQIKKTLQLCVHVHRIMVGEVNGLTRI